jgi:hypothetical protein
MLPLSLSFVMMDDQRRWHHQQEQGGRESYLHHYNPPSTSPLRLGFSNFYGRPRVGEKEKMETMAPPPLWKKRRPLHTTSLSLSLVVVGQSPLSLSWSVFCSGGVEGEGDPEGIVTGKDDIVVAANHLFFSHHFSNHHHSFSLFLFYSTLTATNNTGSKISSKENIKMLANASILRKVASTAIRRSMATEGTLLKKHAHFVCCLLFICYYIV